MAYFVLTVTNLLMLAVVTVNACLNSIEYDAVYDLQGCNMLHPNITQHVPFSGKGCSSKGVLKINLAKSGTENRRILIDMEFASPSSWSFNLGGSPTNDGYGGDAGTTVHDAEMYPGGVGVQSLYGKRSDVGSSGTAFAYPKFFSSRLTLIIGHNNIVFLPNDNNKFNYYDKPHMFDLAKNNVLYLGINRSIYRSSRSGRGLCKVSFKFLPQL